MVQPQNHESVPVPAFDPQAVQVFGEKRLLATLGHEASPETTAAFVDAVSTICEAAERDLNPDSKGNLHQVHTLYPSRGGMPLVLEHDPSPTVQANSHIGGAHVSVANVTRGSFRAGLSFRKYVTNESVFVDPRGTALVQRQVQKVGSSEPPQVAIKPATEDEIRVAIDKVRAAAKATDFAGASR